MPFTDCIPIVDEVPRTCFACFESNVCIQISGRCGPCDAKARLKEKWKSGDLTASETSTSSSSSSSSSQNEESKSELPRFLASSETRLGDIRSGHHSPQSRISTQPVTRIEVQGDGTRQLLPPTQDLIQVPPVLPSEITTTPLPPKTSLRTSEQQAHKDSSGTRSKHTLSEQHAQQYRHNNIH